MAEIAAAKDALATRAVAKANAPPEVYIISLCVCVCVCVYVCIV
jgi:hypothetical protein